MDVKIKILRKRSEEIVEGRGHQEFKEYYNPWATPIDLYGNEIYEALNAKLENVIVFEIKYCKKVKEMQARCKEFRIEYEGDIYEVYHVSFKKNEKKTVLIKANRIS